MEPEIIEDLLITIVKEFTQLENFQRILNEQVLANAIFYSFAVGVLKNYEYPDEAIEDLQYVIDWINDKQDLLMGFNIEKEEDDEDAL